MSRIGILSLFDAGTSDTRRNDDAILWLQNDVATSFLRHNDVISFTIGPIMLGFQIRKLNSEGTVRKWKFKIWNKCLNGERAIMNHICP